MKCAPITDEELVRQFIAYERNRVGDYWAASMAMEAFARLMAERKSK